MYGVMRLTNTAQGDFILLGSFSAVACIAGLKWLAPDLAWLPVLLLPVLLLLAFAVGFVLQRQVLNRVLGKDPLPSLVVTFGLSIVIQNLLLELFSADPRSIESAGLNTASLPLPGGFALGVLPMLILALALAATYGLQWMFNHTALGRSFRAVSDDLEIAQLMGLNAKRVYAYATGIAFMLITVAGVLQAMRTTVSPSGGLVCRSGGGACVFCGISIARRLFRHWHLGDCRSVSVELCQYVCGRWWFGHQPHRLHRHQQSCS